MNDILLSAGTGGVPEYKFCIDLSQKNKLYPIPSTEAIEQSFHLSGVGMQGLRLAVNKQLNRIFGCPVATLISFSSATGNPYPGIFLLRFRFPPTVRPFPGKALSLRTINTRGR